MDYTRVRESEFLVWVTLRDDFGQIDTPAGGAMDKWNWKQSAIVLLALREWNDLPSVVNAPCQTRNLS